MDFAVIDLKIDIEVNGNAHYFKNELKPYYVDRENYIIERGWKVINIHAKAICKDFDSVVNQIKSFLETKNLNFINEIKLQKEVINNDVFNKSQEIIQLIDEGLDNKTIASRLNISGKQLRRFFLAKGIKKLSPCKVNFLKKKKQIFAELAVLDLNEYGLVSKLANKWQTSTTRMSHLIREFKNAK
jgi:CRISPR/Cas system CSM-associated protein Csm2 small subunit